MKMNRLKQQGFSAILALVLVVLLSLLGAYMATLSSISAISAAASGGSIQAWFAARSGIDWAVYQVLNLQTCTGVDGQIISFTSGGLNGFQSVISCPPETSVTEGSSPPYNIYSIGVTATRGNSGDATFVSRTLRVTVVDRNAP